MYLRKRLIYVIIVLHLYCDITYLSATEVKDNIKEKKKFGIVPVPVVAYTPETSFIFGGTAMLYFRPFDDDHTCRPTIIQPILVYTTKKQIIVKLNSDLWWDKNLNHIKNRFDFIDYPTSFWGIGNRTSKDDEESYVHKYYGGKLTYERAIWSLLYVGITYQFHNNKISGTEEGGILATQKITGKNGGNMSGAGGILTWDNRDNVLSASKGMYYQFVSRFYRDVLGSDYEYEQYLLDLRHYYTLFPMHVLALRANFEILKGNPPFHTLAGPGSDNMRGIIQGRYLDKYFMAYEAEYRLPVVWKLGMVFFGSAGEVANKIEDFNTKYFKFACGTGIRFTFDEKEKVKFRFDVGYSEKELQFYLQFLEAF